MAFRFVLALLLLTAPMLAQAADAHADCPAKDLSEHFGHVRDQGAIGNCFAFAAADLIGFNQDLKLPQMVSALDVGLSLLNADPEQRKRELPTAEDWSSALDLLRNVIPSIKDFQKSLDGLTPLERFQAGGNQQDSIMSYNLRGGLCTERQLPSQGSVVDRESSLFIQKQLATMVEANPPNGLVPQSLYSCPSSDPFAKIHSTQEAMNNISMKSVESAAQGACRERIPIKPMKAEEMVIPPDSRALTGKMIAAILAQDVPVGISYDPAFLKQGAEAAPSGGSHAGVIIATRWNLRTNSCEYKLRNSWGPSCKIYEINYRRRCNEGNIWISESDIAKRVTALTIIRPQP